MAYTSVKISANSSDYQSQMKSAAAQMKVLSAEYTTAATKTHQQRLQEQRQTVRDGISAHGANETC